MSHRLYAIETVSLNEFDIENEIQELSGLKIQFLFRNHSGTTHLDERKHFNGKTRIISSRWISVSFFSLS